MHRLSAIALGPLLARAAPQIGNGIVDNATSISQWLTKRLAEPSGKFAAVLTRVADRAWRSLEVALAGNDLHQSAIVSGVDRALVEQIRQFIAVAPLPKTREAFRKQLLIEIQNARNLELIPGPVPSADALAASITRFLAGTSEETPKADAHELAALGKHLRDAGFPALAKFIEFPLKQPPLLISAARYFLSREIASDLLLLRDLRFTRLEILADSLHSGFDRLADAFDRFTTIISALLAELTASLVKEPETVEALPSPVPPPIVEQGFSIHGQHLIAPIRLVESGARIAPCPVCLANAALNAPAEAWVSLRCDSCGTEFQATDGTVPLPPLPNATVGAEPRPRSPLAKNLQMWVDSGGPARWIEYHKGTWSDLEFIRLIDILRVSHYWPLEVIDVRKVLTDMTAQYRTKGSSWGELPSRPYAPPKADAPLELVHTSEFYRTIDGNRWVPCPLCRSFNVEIPPLVSGEIRLTCSGCWKTFIVELKSKPAAALPPPIPPPPATLWRKVRNWFGG